MQMDVMKASIPVRHVKGMSSLGKIGHFLFIISAMENITKAVANLKAFNSKSGIVLSEKISGND